MQELRDELTEARNTSGSPSVPMEPSGGLLAKVWIGLGLAFAVIALGFLPPLFGGLGILFGHLARRKGSKSGGLVTMYVSGTTMALGMVFGALVALLA